MSSPNSFNEKNIEEFRANGGKLGGNFANAPMLLLTTTGKKSGRQHTTPVMYLPDGDRYVVFASKAGAPTSPDWYHNLVANPDVTVEVGAEKFEGKATPAKGQERADLYGQQAKAFPQFAEYQAKTTREIPVVVLTRK